MLFSSEWLKDACGKNVKLITVLKDHTGTHAANHKLNILYGFYQIYKFLVYDI